MTSIDRLNDGSACAPRLRRDLNLGTLLNLPSGSIGYRNTLGEQLALVKAAGYCAVQSWGGWDEIFAAGLRATGIARVSEPGQADTIAREHRARGLDATTLHVGNSFETDREIDALVGAVLESSSRHGYPMFIETHRATLTQDIRRTLDMIERFPEVRFNADLSHWYTGHEMTYGGEFESRVEHLTPVFKRTRFIHGRIGNAGAIQTALDGEGPYVEHFRLMWQRCFQGFLDGAGPGDYLSFNPELLPASIGDGASRTWIHYAQTRSAAPQDPLGGEPSDRFVDAQSLWSIACSAFASAQQAVSTSLPTLVGNQEPG